MCDFNRKVPILWYTLFFRLDGMTDAPRDMGRIFQDRRRAAALSNPRNPTPAVVPTHASSTSRTPPPQPSPRPSLLDIQAEQQQQQQQEPVRGTRGGRADGNGNRYNSGGPSQYRSERGNRRTTHRGPDHSRLPLEQGVICSLRDNFGFIRCAERPEEIFFHYSALHDATAHPDDLQIDTEVQFRVGSSARDADKLAALDVCVLEPGTVVWETEDTPGQRFTGIVERPVRTDRAGDRHHNRNSGKSSAVSTDGTIRVLVPPERTASVENESVEPAPVEAITAKAEGPLLRFTLDDYGQTPGAVESSANSGDVRNTRRSTRLSRGDLVEFSMVTDRRTKDQFARNITLILSEKERAGQEAEKRMLDEATEEHGVVTSLKGDYGFLKSNKRREQVYFHYSSIHLSDDEDGDGADDEDFVLKEGQEMKFLVVQDDREGSNRPSQRRISARKVKAQPRGSVKFHDVLATGMTGVVTMCPQPVDSGHSLEQRGRVRLAQPIHDVDEEGNERVIQEVYLTSHESPGGTYSFHSGADVGVWISIGDTLLFDVWRDFVDEGACHAAPTQFLTPSDHPLNIGSATSDEYLDNESADIDPKRAVRLINMSLAMRAEGVVNAVKEGYGFIHFAERPVDVHFKLYQMLPDELQVDLRRNMGLSEIDEHGSPLRLEPGVEVHFDLSIHGNINSHATSRHHRSRQSSQPHERENMKAQRVLLLPPNTVVLKKVLTMDAEGVISKEDMKQPYAGAVDLEEAVNPMTTDERHPMVAKLIDEYLASDIETPIVFRDIQSVKEDEVLLELIEQKAKGALNLTHIKQSGEPSYKGRVCISKVIAEPSKANEETPSYADEKKDVKELDTDGADESGKGNTKPGLPPVKGRTKGAPKAFKSLRFDKSSLSLELRDDLPPSLDDRVTLDVVQSRRTGQCVLENIRVVERHISEISVTEATGLGVVHEVVPARQFGFISVLDDNAAKREILFFNLSSVLGASPETESTAPANKKKALIRKGDEVKFDIGTEKNGKRVALNVTVLPKETISSKPDPNACKGIILLQPAYTTLKNTPIRHASSAVSQEGGKPGRWDSIDEDRKKPSVTEPVTEQGCILLLEDPLHMFGVKAGAAVANESGDKADGSSPLLSTLRYKKGALAAQGAGSSLAVDQSSHPRRGDLVSFVPSKNGKGLRDVRVLVSGQATLMRGRLQDLNFAAGTADFYAANEDEDKYPVELAQIVGCKLSVLKEDEAVEGILHEGKLYGLCRTTDLYLESKLGTSRKERPKLNLAVKKARAGHNIPSQAKGPDGTNGFVPGWTTRVSQYADGGTVELTEVGTIDTTGLESTN